MSKVIDVSHNCGAFARQLAAAGVETVIRYYSRDTIRPQKPLSRSEAELLTAAGLRLAIVYEGRRGDKLENFDHATGLLDGRFARTYAHRVIGQPGGSAIYFAVDLDVLKRSIDERIIPYFEGVQQAFAGESGEPTYPIGVYGSGAVCAAVLDAGLAECCWLAQSTGWTGYRRFADSDRWTMKQGMPITIASVDCDPNEVAPGALIGDFDLAIVPRDTRSADPMRVNARSGLRLRKGPGTDFPSKRTLRQGTIVHPLSVVAGWTLVDLEGDGAADGFVSSEFLAETQDAPSLPPSDPSDIGGITADSLRVDELVAAGSSSAGLAQARDIATREFIRLGIPPYPTNGCAAHLSALLQLAAIDVPMTWGAGSLARKLLQRGWSEIAVGAQRPGDVGVTFDRDPSPPGADHVYLVIQSMDGDRMLIADNQWKKDEPHERFASGKGKTETEYFLRAV